MRSRACGCCSTTAMGTLSAVTRDYVFDLDETGGAPLFNVFGGKITTFRKLA